MLEYILFVLGIFFLVKGADYLVDGASSLGYKLGVSTLVIGLTIVAFGTSMPELVVNIVAALNGSTDVAFGNIIGSNIANILLVLGVVAIISPIKVKRSTVWKEIPFALLSVVVLFVVSNYLLIDKINIGSLTRVSGLVLLSFFAIFIYYTIDLARKNRQKVEKSKLGIVKMSNYQIFFLIVLGLVGLYFGGKWAVEGAVFIAQQFGLSEFLISATVIAIGTSLPELVTGIAAARKKETGLAVGNSIGSNIFNIFWIFGVTALVAPILIPSFINLDLVILFSVTLLLFVFLFIGKKHELERWQGYLFLLLYLAYLVFIVLRG
jgi:cation:H+ antiporter